MLRPQARSSGVTVPSSPRSAGPPIRAARESPITAPATPVTAGPTGDGVTVAAPTRSVSEVTRPRPVRVPCSAATPAPAHSSTEAVTATTVIRPIGPARSSQCTGRYRRARVRCSAISSRAVAISPLPNSATSTMPVAPHRYQVTNPSPRSRTASPAPSTVCGPRTGPLSAGRFNGPIDSRGRIGPHTCTVVRSNSALPSWAICAGPDSVSGGTLAPTPTSWPNTSTWFSGVSRITSGTPTTAISASSNSVGSDRASRSSARGQDRDVARVGTVSGLRTARSGRARSGWARRHGGPAAVPESRTSWGGRRTPRRSDPRPG